MRGSEAVLPSVRLLPLTPALSPRGRGSQFRTNTPTKSTCVDHRNCPTGSTQASRYPSSTNIFASRAKLLGLHETYALRGTLHAASADACSRAPARGGSSTTASKRSSSATVSGRR